MTEETAIRKTRPEKADGAFRTISEVSQSLEVQQHVLRFWETKFAQVKPVKRGGGRRYYRPEDIELLRHIHKLLYSEGYTIKGVQKLLKTQTKSELMDAARAGNDDSPRASAFPSPGSRPVTSTIKDSSLVRQQRQSKILQSVLDDLVELREHVRKAREADSD